jgi:hypothetical protein
MSRTDRILVVIAVGAALIAGGKYSAMMILTALAPLYAWLLASIFFMVCFALATVIVPIGQKIAEKREMEAQIVSEERGKAA